MRKDVQGEGLCLSKRVSICKSDIIACTNVCVFASWIVYFICTFRWAKKQELFMHFSYK